MFFDFFPHHINTIIHVYIYCIKRYTNNSSGHKKSGMTRTIHVKGNSKISDKLFQ